MSAKLVKDSAIYRRVRAALLRSLRRSTVARRLAKAARLGRVGGGGAFRPLSFTAGRAIPENAVGQGVNVLIIAHDADASTADALLRSIQQQQLMSPGIRPVIIGSPAVLKAARRYGYVVEVLNSIEVWADQSAWRRYIDRHVSRIQSMYGVQHVVQVSNTGWTTAGGSLVSISSLSAV